MLSLRNLVLASLVCAGSAIAVPVAINSSFETRTDGNPTSYGWKPDIQTNDSVKATGAVDSVTGTAKSGQNFYRITVTSVSSQNWHIQLKDPTWPAKKGQIYHMRLWARADSTRKAQISVYGNQTDVNTYRTSSGITLTKEWKEYHQVFISDAEGAGKINFAFVCGFEPGTYDVDSVTIDESPSNGTMFANGGFEADGAGWSLYVNNDSTSKAKATMSIETTGAKEGTKFCRINVTAITPVPKDSAAKDWHIQLQDGAWMADSLVTYTIKLWAKSDSARKIQIVAQGGSASNYKYYEGAPQTLTTEWAEYEYTYQSMVTGSDSLNFFIYCGTAVGKYDFDGISLTKDTTTSVHQVLPAVKNLRSGFSVELSPKSLICTSSKVLASNATVAVYDVSGRHFVSKTILAGARSMSFPRPPAGTWVVTMMGERSLIVIP